MLARSGVFPAGSPTPSGFEIGGDRFAVRVCSPAVRRRNTFVTNVTLRRNVSRELAE